MDQPRPQRPSWHTRLPPLTTGTPAVIGAASFQSEQTIVSGPSIYDPDRFKNVTLSPETASRLAHPGRRDFRLNRLLLQDAFPTELAKSGKHDWGGAFLFALAIAVGLTPEMLPMIVVRLCLSKGAMAMSKKKVIVKRLNSIQNFGAMDVLCTDKTGTLTRDHVILEIHCDVFKNDERHRFCLTRISSVIFTGTVRPEKCSRPRGFKPSGCAKEGVY